ncbi:phosphoenolpyruvate--protein phosphotransferase [uncultured Endozoicomonas sp.]|uniref:phosphoenolpyruvate--protein phosphotransferase n=1 Tax=uncultured Endozoicomonas sp. TaxID=432652 RepID=UPI00260D7DEE|nr:phosphoenolpyruvate--protein phosphotransferase [uncultured Endozoicomonas sp.]
MTNQITFEFSFPLPNGLHARPANAITEVVKTLGCRVSITNLRNQKVADASSVLSMIACDIALHDQCLFSIDSFPEQETASSAEQLLKQFLEGDFIHCDDALPELNTDQKPLPYMLRQETMNSLPGTAVSSGMAKGKAVHLGEPELALNPENIEIGAIDVETARFEEARQHLLAVMEHQAEQSSGEEQAIIKAHMALLCDQELISQLHSQLSSGESILNSVLTTQSYYSELLATSKNTYLRERVLDIRDVCSRLICEVYGAESFRTSDTTLTEDSICIAAHLAPSQFLALDRQQLKGLILESGGSTSHTVILARSFGIPVLAGVEQAGSHVPAGTACILDANHNLLIVDPSTAVARYYQLENLKQDRLAIKRQRFLGEKASTQDGQTIEVAANIASAEEATTAFNNGAEAIGLFRTEMLYMDRSQAPFEDEQVDIYRRALEAAGDRPVIIRTMDIGGDKPVDYFNIGTEENPFLGYRAVRIYPEYLDYFKTQLRAILRAANYGQCKIMIPMVATVAEAKWLRKTFNEVIESLHEEQITHNSNVPLGMMLEVPSCAFVIDQLARYMDFFSIGSNDLTQYFLAADRGNAYVENLYDSLNPAFLRQLKHIIDEVHKAGSWVGMCGEFAGDPIHMPLLIGLGLDEISLGSPRIPEVKEAISTLNADNCKSLLCEALTLETADDVRTLLMRNRQNSSANLPILTLDTILFDAECHSKAEVIKTLIDNLQINERLIDSAGAETAIWDREDISPTMLGFGIAIPHCKSDTIGANTISIMKLKEPVLWNEDDDVLTDTVFMLTVRASDAGNTHMKIFAQLARRIMRDEFRHTLATCQSQQELMAYISQELEL